VTEHRHRQELVAFHRWEQLGLGRAQDTTRPGRWHADAHWTGFGRASGWVPHTHGARFEAALAAARATGTGCTPQTLDELAKRMQPARRVAPEPNPPDGQLGVAGAPGPVPPSAPVQLSA
jgi:hypothetical protein